MRRIARINLLLILVGLFAIAGVLRPAARAQDSPTQAATNMFVGPVEGTDAFIGLATNGDEVVAYICDGVGDSIADFFSGAAHGATDGALPLSTEENRDLLTLYADAASLPELMGSGDSISGAFQTPDGAAHYFRVDPASGPGALYRTDEMLPDGSQAEGGWVVLNNGEVRGQISLLSPSSFQPLILNMSAGEPGMFLTSDRQSQTPIAPMESSMALLTALQNASPPIPQGFPLFPTSRNNQVITMNTLTVARVNPVTNICAVTHRC